MVLSQMLKFCKQKPIKIENVDKDFAKKFNFKSLKFATYIKDYAKQENKIIFSLMYLIRKVKHHTVFILQNKLLKHILIYYYYQILKLPIMF